MSTLQLRQIAESMDRLKEAATRTSFVALDWRLSVTPQEDRPAASWEVEREQFLRRFPDYDPG